MYCFYVNSCYNKCPGVAGTLGIFLDDGLVVSGVNFGKQKIIKESIKNFNWENITKVLGYQSKIRCFMKALSANCRSQLSLRKDIWKDSSPWGWWGTGTGFPGKGSQHQGWQEFKKPWDNTLRHTVWFLAWPVLGQELEFDLWVPSNWRCSVILQAEIFASFFWDHKCWGYIKNISLSNWWIEQCPMKWWWALRLLVYLESVSRETLCIHMSRLKFSLNRSSLNSG